MIRRVLLVDWNVDALGELASALRAHGLTVANANEPFDAVEQAVEMRPDVVLAAKEMDSEGTLTAALRAVPELSDTPLFLLVEHADDAQLGPGEVPRSDIERVVSRITGVSPRDSRPLIAHDLRGSLEQTPLVDLLQLLTMNRRSGVLTVTTGGGAGEVRLCDGEVIDAIFRRLEGEKAFYRMLGEPEGHFAFTPGDGAGVRRIQAQTSALIMEGMRQVDETRRRRSELTPSGEALFVPDVPSRRSLGGLPRGELVGEVAIQLQIPRAVDELLDELPAPDLAILDAVAALAAAGRVRRIPLAELTTPFAPSEQLPVLRALVTRLERKGFAPPPRLVIATPPKRVAALSHAVRRITDAVPSTDAPPIFALPRLLGTLRLGDGVDLALAALPTDPLFAPTWPLALPGAGAVVRLEAAGGEILEAHCQGAEITLIEAESVMGAIDVAVPAQVAALLRTALEVAAGV